VHWDYQGGGGGDDDDDDDGGQQTGEVGMTLLLASIQIVTNTHVVRTASTVCDRASFGPHVVNCEVEWLSLPLDLALLKIALGDWDDFRKGWGIADVFVVEEGGGTTTQMSVTGVRTNMTLGDGRYRTVW
jgi:hypothetical protein